jgi:hypothetical protein
MHSRAIPSNVFKTLECRYRPFYKFSPRHLSLSLILLFSAITVIDAEDVSFPLAALILRLFCHEVTSFVE